MNRWLGWLMPALVLAVGCSPAARASDIYKCKVNGSTAYRDQPCSTAKPEAGRLSKSSTREGSVVIGDSPEALLDGIRRLTERERQLQAQHDRELEQLRARMAGVRDDQTVRQEVGEFNRGWQQRFAENDRQRKEVLNRLRQLCPGGASGGSGHATCEKQGR